MRHIHPIAFVTLFLFNSLILTIEAQSNKTNDLTLWYNQPAANWNEALPIGNGRLGAMVFGNPVTELIQLNEESIWAGSQINNNNPEALKNLPAFRNAIFNNRFDEA